MQLKILTLNSWFLPIISIYSGQRAQLLADYINKEKFDIVFLQEVMDSRARKKLAGLCKDYNNFYSRSGLAGSGLLLLSKLPILSSKFFNHSQVFSFFYPYSVFDFIGGKGFQLVIVQAKNGKKIVLINVHSQAPIDAGKEAQNRAAVKMQMKQLKGIIQHLDSYNINDYPVIFAGDFNFRPGTTQCKFVLENFIDSRANFNEFYTNDKNNTYLKYGIPFGSPFGSPRDGYKIDYIFLDKNHQWLVSDCKRVLDEKYSIKRKMLHLSDHYGVAIKASLDG